jgi:AP-1-like factor
VSLKQSPFTFAVPKTAGGNAENAQASTSFTSQSPAFSPSSRLSAQSPVSSRPSPTSPKIQNPLEWSSLSSFDPAMLSLLDDSPQTTATDGAMQMDFGFGASANPGLTNNTPYTTIASNPMFMSFASTFDSASPATSTTDPHNAFNFDMSGLSTWSPPAQQNEQSLDDLLNGYMARSDYAPYSAGSTASESPITHHSAVNHINTSTSRSPAFSNSSSPSSITSDPLFDTPRDGSTSDSDIGHEGHNESECPKTKGELVKRIETSGPSPFAPAANPKTLRKNTDDVLGTMIMCEGSNFPKTQQSDQNIEVLSAWRSITSNPQFKVRSSSAFPYDPSLTSNPKDIDINELCSEFTDKARCDGTKVVLEPQGVSCILKNLSNPKK